MTPKSKGCGKSFRNENNIDLICGEEGFRTLKGKESYIILCPQCKSKSSDKSESRDANVNKHKHKNVDMSKNFSASDLTPKEKRPNYFGLKVCQCGQIYDGRFEEYCPVCNSDIWNNLRLFHVLDNGKMHLNCNCLAEQRKEQRDFDLAIFQSLYLMNNKDRENR